MLYQFDMPIGKDEATRFAADVVDRDIALRAWVRAPVTCVHKDSDGVRVEENHVVVDFLVRCLADARDIHLLIDRHYQKLSEMVGDDRIVTVIVSD